MKADDGSVGSARRRSSIGSIGSISPLALSVTDDDLLEDVPKDVAGKSDGALEYCPACGDMPCGGCPEKRCSACERPMGDGDDADVDGCDPCETIPCSVCSAPSFFDCRYCDRLLCGCVANVRCEGPGCQLSNCMECAESGDGEVLFCSHCGKGFCNDCKSMEFCHCLQGDVCPECHCEMHDYDVECYWRHLPPELPQIVADFAAEVSEDGLAEFWHECIQFLKPDRDFDKHLYRRTRKARAAALILASYYLLRGRDNEAVYLILYASLLEEVWNRGSNYVAQFYRDPSSPPSTKILSIYFTSFHSVIVNTTSRANTIALLHNQLPSIRPREGKKLFECINVSLGKIPKSYAPIHSIPVPSAEDYEIELRGQYDGHSMSMNIVTSNIENDTKQKNFVYKDTTFGWWLKIHVIKCSYHQWQTGPVTPSTKSFRVVHKGNTIILGSAGRETFHQLGVKDGDEIVFEGVESEDGSNQSKSQDIADTCTVCSPTKSDNQRASYTIDTCQACGKSARNIPNDAASSFFGCQSCGRSICGCVLEVPCEGSGCGLSNCMECAENGDGDVLYCTNCGRGFCTGCKPMDFCFCLVGDTCPECHTEMHDADVECYWKYVPSELGELVAEYADEVSKELIAVFWHGCTKFLPSDKDFDVQLYRETRVARAASLILASDHFLKGHDNEAVYLILYSALLEEVLQRGANYITRVLSEHGSQRASYEYDFDVLSISFTSFRSVVGKTTTKANAIAYLHSQLPSIQKEEGKDLLKCLDYALGKQCSVDDRAIHSIPLISASDYHRGLVGQYGGSSTMNLITSNLDSGRKEEATVYKDMTLGWWLNIYFIKSSYQNSLRNQEMPPPTKYLRVVHQGKSIFLSSAGKKPLSQLGINDGDEIVVGGVEPEAKTNQTNKTPLKTKTKKKSKKKSGAGKKKKKKQPAPAPSLTEEQLVEKHRQEHSRTMTPVFEELGPLLKEKRNRLNDLTIKKSAPKKRKPKSSSARKMIQQGPTTLSLPAEDSLGGKAGKVAYPIVVGECTNLYNTSRSKASRSLSRAPILLDLHGHSRDDALIKLDESLPEWINTAMRGEYPWIIPVDIICGGGNQILSELVQNWIRSNRHVANRPKGFI